MLALLLELFPVIGPLLFAFDLVHTYTSSSSELALWNVINNSC